MNILTRPTVDADADRAWDANSMQRDWAEAAATLATSISEHAGNWCALVVQGLAGWPPSMTSEQREQLLQDMAVLDERLAAFLGH